MGLHHSAFLVAVYTCKIKNKQLFLFFSQFSKIFFSFFFEKMSKLTGDQSHVIVCTSLCTIQQTSAIAISKEISLNLSIKVFPISYGYCRFLSSRSLRIHVLIIHNRIFQPTFGSDSSGRRKCCSVT